LPAAARVPLHPCKRQRISLPTQRRALHARADRGLVRQAPAQPRARYPGGCGPPRSAARDVMFTTDGFHRLQPIEFPGGQHRIARGPRHGQRPVGRRRRPALPQPQLLHRGRPRGGAARARDPRRGRSRVRGWREDRRRRHQGRPSWRGRRPVPRHHGRGRAALGSARFGSARSGPATACSSAGPGWATTATAVMLVRARVAHGMRGRPGFRCRQRASR